MYFDRLRTTRFTLLLLLLAVPLAGCDSSGDDDDAPDRDIVEVAVANDFTTLVTALEAAELEQTLKGDGPFTVFAPTDAAFGELDQATLNALLQPENRDQLTNVLTYHVVAGRVPAEEVVERSAVTTLQGASLAIEVRNGDVFVDGAQVTSTDIEATNGIVHVIDGVLLPPSLD